MKHFLLSVMLIASASAFGADINSSQLQGSFSGEVHSSATKDFHSFFNLNGDKLYSNMLDFEHMKCVALDLIDTNYDEKMVCQEYGDAPLGDVYILKSKKIMNGKVYVNGLYMGSHSKDLIDTVKTTGFLGSKEIEFSFVLNRN